MLIKNLTSVLSKESLEKYYYKCNPNKAKKMVTRGFIPVTIDEEGDYLFLKTELLMKFLEEGGEL